MGESKVYHYYIGIDLGTESTKVAFIRDGQQQPTILPFDNKDYILSTWDSNSNNIGVEGEVYSILKIEMNEESRCMTEDEPNIRLRICEDKFKGFFKLLIDKIKNEIKKTAEISPLQEVEFKRIAVGFPPSFNFNTRRKYYDMLRAILGENVRIRIYDETLASFFYFYHLYNNEQNNLYPGKYLLIDSGAGTTDAAVIELRVEENLKSIGRIWYNGISIAGNVIDREIIYNIYNQEQDIENLDRLDIKIIKEKLNNSFNKKRRENMAVNKRNLCEQVRGINISFYMIEEIVGRITEDIFKKIFDDYFRNSFCNNNNEIKGLNRIFFVGRTTLFAIMRRKFSELYKCGDLIPQEGISPEEENNVKFACARGLALLAKENEEERIRICECVGKDYKIYIKNNNEGEEKVFIDKNVFFPTPGFVQTNLYIIPTNDNQNNQGVFVSTDKEITFYKLNNQQKGYLYYKFDENGLLHLCVDSEDSMLSPAEANIEEIDKKNLIASQATPQNIDESLLHKIINEGNEREEIFSKLKNKKLKEPILITKSEHLENLFHNKEVIYYFGKYFECFKIEVENESPNHLFNITVSNLLDCGNNANDIIKDGLNKILAIFSKIKYPSRKFELSQNIEKKLQEWQTLEQNFRILLLHIGGHLSLETQKILLKKISDNKNNKSGITQDILRKWWDNKISLKKDNRYEIGALDENVINNKSVQIEEKNWIEIFAEDYKIIGEFELRVKNKIISELRKIYRNDIKILEKLKEKFQNDNRKDEIERLFCTTGSLEKSLYLIDLCKCVDLCNKWSSIKKETIKEGIKTINNSRNKIMHFHFPLTIKERENIRKLINSLS